MAFERRFIVGVLSATLVALASAAPLFAESAVQGLHGIERFMCHGSLIQAGETKEQVLAKCGEPAWRDTRTESFLEDVGKGPNVVSVTTDEWIYDFGHNQLLEFLRFRDGRLVTIRSGNYGFGGFRNGDCGYGANLSLGDSKLEVVAKCGEPAAGGAGEDRIGETGDPEERRDAFMATDEWMFDFGPDHFMYYLTFRHGRVMEIRSGGYGRASQISGFSHTGQCCSSLSGSISISPPHISHMSGGGTTSFSYFLARSG